MAGNIHVVPADGGWAVEVEGGGRSNVHYTSQADAIQNATEAAKRAKVELIIHGRDGQIRERNSFGNDPRDVKG
ncbi:DUF2188 domain-containing protein [Cupriavidus gilardii]|nr:DUF2188 domain-containing protein [Cupriavidus gilardii]